MERYFDQDKNYILRQIQNESKSLLCIKAVKLSIENFLIQENPLGIEDDFIRDLRQKSISNVEFLYPTYSLLAAVYRFYHGKNQLEFIWDGRSQEEVYFSEWQDFYLNWIYKTGLKTSLNRIILKACVLYSDQPAQFLAASLNRFVYQDFRIKKLNNGYLEKVA